MGDDNKIYVGGLAAETTSESLRAHFTQFGEITDCVVMPDKATGRSRCFGFITFKDTGSMNAALGTSNLVDGREVACKKAVRESPALPGQSGDGMYNTVKIFVGGLPASCDYDKFTSYFGRFGHIEDAVVMMDSQTQRHRGFGYVTFSDTSAVEATLQNYAANQIDGKWIEVKRCIPQDKMAPGQSFKGRGKASGRRDASPSRGPPASAPPAGPGPAPPGAPGYGYGYGGYGYGGAFGAPPGAPGDPYGGAYGYGAYGAYGAYPGYPGYGAYGCYGGYGGYGSMGGAPMPPRYGYRPAPY